MTESLPKNINYITISNNTHKIETIPGIKLKLYLH